MGRQLTEEQKQVLRDRLANARAAKAAAATAKQEIPETPVSVPEPEIKPPEPVDLNLTPWTVDFRDYLPENLTQKDVDKVIADLKDDHKRLEGIFCTDDQAEALKNVNLPKDIFINVGR